MHRFGCARVPARSSPAVRGSPTASTTVRPTCRPARAHRAGSVSPLLGAVHGVACSVSFDGDQSLGEGRRSVEFVAAELESVDDRAAHVSAFGGTPFVADCFTDSALCRAQPGPAYLLVLRSLGHATEDRSDDLVPAQFAVTLCPCLFELGVALPASLFLPLLGDWIMLGCRRIAAPPTVDAERFEHVGCPRFDRAGAVGMVGDLRVCRVPERVLAVG